MEKLDKELSHKLEEIKQSLESKDSNRGNSLMSGKAGEALFFFHHFEYTGNKNSLYKSNELLMSIFDNMDNERFSFAQGYAGVGWLLSYCAYNNWIDVDVNSILEDLDHYIYNKSLRLLESSNYDYLHGAMGGLIYFLSREKNNLRKSFLEKFVTLINNIAEEDEKYAKWNFYDFVKNEKKNDNYNFGLSHGIPSIISCLSFIEKEGIKVKTCQILIKKAIDFLVKNMIDPLRYNCYMPNDASNERITRSRLAWCYGDLGVACCYWNVYRNSKAKPSLVHENLIKILDYGSTRRNLSLNRVFDSGLCHGTSGIGHIFNVMFLRTGNEIYRETSKFWFEQTLLNASFENGSAGFMKYDLPSNSYYDERGFLEGISGIGLSIISFLSKKELNWDRALLIN